MTRGNIPIDPQIGHSAGPAHRKPDSPFRIGFDFRSMASNLRIREEGIFLRFLVEFSKRTVRSEGHPDIVFFVGVALILTAVPERRLVFRDLACIRIEHSDRISDVLGKPDLPLRIHSRAPRSRWLHWSRIR